MASSFRQWESDPLFSAAEVVQDAADRMESLFRLLSHEQSLGQEIHIDVKLLKSIEYHRRDLATTLETAKWQLEDFEREVNLLATLDRSHSRENTISRYRQFIEAITEQILNVEKNLGSTSVGDLRKSIKSVNFDEQDRHGLELFLSGESPSEHVARHDLEDSNIMKKFLDPTMTSSLNDEIIEKNRGDNLNINGHVHLNHNFDLMENKLQKVDSHYSTQMNFEAPPSLQEIAPNRFVEDGGWDLEANGATSKDSFCKDRLRWYNGQRNILGH
ncbi:uncharacterized protein LOC127790141 [Diospyros lotus]|uniref:uncharacterized protein LOC127790141 n=1 Tax=Diospyros lotus TaxID=55363 RepID=UPI0022556C94|nr:uncharacterized protein LOC127790141 [Diospyros lotus]